MGSKRPIAVLGKADDPALLEGNDSEADDIESKALLTELQKLVAQAGELASAQGVTLGHGARGEPATGFLFPPEKHPARRLRWLFFWCHDTRGDPKRRTIESKSAAGIPSPHGPLHNV
jgi:hypothetical protein